MSTMVQSQLKAGVIFGDTENNEYVYMPASEIGIALPICVYEHQRERDDVSFTEAAHLIRIRSLRPVCHPVLGQNSC